MPFVKGQSGNPAGRPAGSRNKFTREMDEALEAHGTAVIEKIVTHAHAANPAAMRLCLDRLVPQGKHRPSAVELPPPETPNYVLVALTEIHRALGAGEITSEEASRLVGFVGRTARVLASKAVAEIDFADRLDRGEEALGLALDAAQEPPAPAEGAIDNNNAETMDAAPRARCPAGPSAAKTVPPVPVQPPPAAKDNENPLVAAALDRAVEAGLADVRPRRRNSVKEQLMNSLSPSALLVGEITEKVLARKTKSVMLPQAPPARAA